MERGELSSLQGNGAEGNDVESEKNLAVFWKYVQNLCLAPEGMKDAEAIDYLRKELKGKRILDVGAGSAGFATACAKLGIGEVTSLDLAQRNLVATKASIYSDGAKEKFVVGRAEKLPFADASFDLVVSQGVVPLEFSRPSEYNNIAPAISEMVRVSRPSGEVRFTHAALYGIDRTTGIKKPFTQFNAKVTEALDALQQQGCTVVIQEATARDGRGKTFDNTIAIIRKSKTIPQ